MANAISVRPSRSAARRTPGTSLPVISTSSSSNTLSVESPGAPNGSEMNAASSSKLLTRWTSAPVVPVASSTTTPGCRRWNFERMGPSRLPAVLSSEPMRSAPTGWPVRSSPSASSARRNSRCVYERSSSPSGDSTMERPCRRNSERPSRCSSCLMRVVTLD